MDQFEKNVFGAIYGRRSIRQYAEKAVEREKLIKLLKAGMAAPSACNLQPWEFVVVTEEEALTELRKATPPYNAPAAMVVCANTGNIPWEGEGWMLDCGAAVENMMIAAVALGLGSVWIGAFDTDAVRKLFSIPESIRVMSVVYFGYAEKEKTPKTKFSEEAVYWEKYDAGRERALRTMDMLMTDGYQET